MQPQGRSTPAARQPAPGLRAVGAAVVDVGACAVRTAVPAREARKHERREDASAFMYRTPWWRDIAARTAQQTQKGDGAVPHPCKNVGRRDAVVSHCMSAQCSTPNKSRRFSPFQALQKGSAWFLRPASPDIGQLPPGEE